MDAWECACDNNFGQSTLYRKLNNVTNDMQHWSGSVFCFVCLDITRHKVSFDGKERALGSRSLVELHEIEAQLHLPHAWEEIMYMQHARLELLEEDEQNMSADGMRCTTDNEMGKMSADFYAWLFS